MGTDRTLAKLGALGVALAVGVLIGSVRLEAKSVRVKRTIEADVHVRSICIYSGRLAVEYEWKDIAMKEARGQASTLQMPLAGGPIIDGGGQELSPKAPGELLGGVKAVSERVEGLLGFLASGGKIAP